MTADAWVDLVELAIESAREVGTETYTAKQLYLAIGRKLRDEAGEWWIRRHQCLSELRNRDKKKRGMAWESLRPMFLDLYGDPKDAHEAEQEMRDVKLVDSTPYLTYAEELRAVVGRSPVPESAILHHFYDQLTDATLYEVRRDPEPRTLEEAAARATRIDYRRNRRALKKLHGVTRQADTVTYVSGTNGSQVVLPGVGAVDIVYLRTRLGVRSTEDLGECIGKYKVQQGILNARGTKCIVPRNREWDRSWGLWVLKRGSEARGEPNAIAGSRSTTAHAAGRDVRDTRAKVWRVTAKRRQQSAVRRFDSGFEDESSSEASESDDRGREPNSEDDASPRAKRRAPQRKSEPQKSSAIVRQVVRSASGTMAAGSGPPSASKGPGTCYRCGKSGHFMRDCPVGIASTRCYICNKVGHFAQDCTVEGAEIKREEYRQRRTARVTSGKHLSNVERGSRS